MRLRRNRPDPEPAPAAPGAAPDRDADAAQDASAAAWLAGLDDGRGWRRLAGAVVVLALAVGLAAGGLVGARTASRPAAGEAPAAAKPVPFDASGPLGELAGLTPMFSVDDQGGTFKLHADGTGRERVGGLADLASRRGTLDDRLFTSEQLAAAPDPGSVQVPPRADRAYLRLADGTPAVERFADPRPRRLLPEGWEQAGDVRLSRDGATVATCGFQRDADLVIDRVRTWITDGDGRSLATLPGCVYDLAPDGSAALVSDPVRSPPPGPASRSRRASSPGASQTRSLTRGLRIWRRSGGFQPVLRQAELVRAYGQVQPEADPTGVAVIAAELSPDRRQALVLAENVLQAFDLNAQSPEVLALLMVDLGNGHAQLLPGRFPSIGPWVPTGGYITPGQSDTITFVPPGSSAPTVLRVLTAGVTSMDVSPDGAWLLLVGERWTFIRIDDPSVAVSYRAPGRFAGWGSGS
jgi:hypothetical protein